MMVFIISRAPRFSPNAEEKDKQLITLIKEHLHQSGCSTFAMVEDDVELLVDLHRVDCLLSMARSQQAIQQLERFEAQGIPIYNSAKALLQYPTRESRLKRLKKAKIPVPPYRSFEKDGNQRFKYPVWLKASRLDTPGRHVKLFQNRKELYSFIETPQVAKIGSFSVERHIVGQLMKFYAIPSKDFYRIYVAPQTNGNTAPDSNDWEEIDHLNSANAQLFQYVKDASRAFNFHFLGGDAIIDDKGVPHFFDINDFPSFSPCAQLAAKAIADFLISQEF